MRMGDASMTHTEAGNYDFMTAEFLVIGRPRYEGRFCRQKCYLIEPNWVVKAYQILFYKPG